MGWLAKFGTTILKGITLATGFLGLLQGVSPSKAPAIQEISDDLTKVAGMVTTAEAVGQALSLPGAQKLQAAAPLVAQVVLQADFMIGHKVKDQAKFTTGVNSLASGMADILSSLE